MKKKALVKKTIYIDRVSEYVVVVDLYVLGVLVYRKIATPESVTKIGLKPL